jgi:hypothetical protein
MEEVVPNFLIVGAAKSGTTAVASYLAQHPEVYISPIKEPKFISSQFLDLPLQGVGDDLVEALYVKRYEDYIKLFRGVRDEQMVGEASVDNLYFYSRAIPLIKHYFGDVKILILLRDPVDRAFSAYTHLVRDSRESLSFEDALAAEDDRRRRNWEFLWHYTAVGFYSQQIRAYLESFSNVKICLFDDLKRGPRSLLREVFRFLGVDETFVPCTKVRYNSSGQPRNPLLRRVLTPTPLKLGMLRGLFALGLSEQRIYGVIDRFRENSVPRPPMRPETRRQLKQLFRGDILMVQRLLRRDLSRWLA